VATSAAEEGLDIPACELVVRFSAAASGIVRAQSRGRARVRGSRVLSLVSGGDAPLHKKARLEEQAMQEYLQGLAAAGGGGAAAG
jgi:ERCC4-related helicase